jgi:glycosyltransferase involved in cell wall biosynthesis
MPREPRVLVLHNRYRTEGGEERAVELQAAALARAGVDHRLLERRSGDSGRTRAAAALLRGGEDPAQVAAAVRDLRADVVHAHNIQPLLGPRALAGARAAGARVVAQLHNFRLFCAIGVASRDGGPCFRCHHRRTLPGLALNCRGSVAEAAVYAAGLALHQSGTVDAVDAFVVPSESTREQVVRLGLPPERVAVVRHYLPDSAFGDRSGAGRGRYALVTARLSEEKGVDVAIRAAALTGVPLRVAGDGPAHPALARLVDELRAPVELLGRADRPALAELLRGAAVVLVPSRFHETAGYAAMEAMAAGVPVLASRLGALPETVGPERCVPMGDADALAARLAELWARPALRDEEGGLLIERARERHSEERYVRELLDLYARTGEASALTPA